VATACCAFVAEARTFRLACSRQGHARRSTLEHGVLRTAYVHHVCDIPRMPAARLTDYDTERVPGTSLHYKPSDMRIPAGRSAAQDIQPPV
jgi:hypothetical protein